MNIPQFGQAPDDAAQLAALQASVRQDLTAFLWSLAEQYFQPKVEAGGFDELTDGPLWPVPGTADDETLVNKARRSKSDNEVTFDDLWMANADKLGRKWPPNPDSKSGLPYDASSADQALINHFVWWTGGDCARVERLMQREDCALRRPKWDERPDYRRDTILNALALVAKNPPKDKTMSAPKFGGTLPAGAAPTPNVPGNTPAPPAAMQTTEPEAWSEPLNFFGDNLEAQPFTGGEFPTAISAYPMLHAEQTGIDSGITLNAALTATAAAIPDHVKLCADSHSNWTVSAIFWHLVIGSPGAGKSPSHEAALRPLWDIFNEEKSKWAQECMALGASKENPAEGGSPDKPPMPRVIIRDATIEALAIVLEETPRGILIANDEFSAWMGGMDQYKAGGVGGRDRAEWMRLFDGGQNHIERAKQGPRSIPNWGASVLSATTPHTMDLLARHLGEDGLIQRFAPYIARDQVLRADTPRPAEHLTAAYRRYNQLIRALWSLAPCIIHFSPEARERFGAWRIENQRLRQALSDSDSALASHVAKHPTILLRVALVFHCAQVMDTGQPNPSAHPLSLATLELAAKYLRRSFQHARVMYGRRGSPAMDLARDIARFILTRPTQNVLQRRDLAPSIRAYRAADEGVQARALRLIEDFGWLRAEPGRYFKDQPTRYAVNPSIAAKFKALADAEAARRETVRSLIAETVQELREDK